MLVGFSLVGLMLSRWIRPTPSSSQRPWNSGLDGFGVLGVSGVVLALFLSMSNLAVGVTHTSPPAPPPLLAFVFKQEGDQLFLFEIPDFGVGIWVGDEYLPGGAIHSGRAGGFTAAGNGFVASDSEPGLDAGEEFDGFIVGDKSPGKHVVATLALRV
jgi:hypothetical protein